MLSVRMQRMSGPSATWWFGREGEIWVEAPNGGRGFMRSTELFHERVPLGPCAGLMNLLNMFSVVNKPQRGGGACG